MMETYTRLVPPETEGRRWIQGALEVELAELDEWLYDVIKGK